MLSSAMLDPELWLRLEPAIHKRRVERAEALATHRLDGAEAYREAQGYIRGLDDVIAMAAELCRRDQGDRPINAEGEE